jgi:hypothetical protein
LSTNAGFTLDFKDPPVYARASRAREVIVKLEEPWAEAASKKFTAQLDRLEGKLRKNRNGTQSIGVDRRYDTVETYGLFTTDYQRIAAPGIVDLLAQ